MGSSGLALEVGHLTVNPEGRPCYCGGHGCLDVETDPLAFLTAAGREPGPEVSLLQQSIDLIRGHCTDPGRPRPTRTLIDRPGLGLAGLVNILNPDRIILGGLHRALLDADPERLRAGRRRPQPVGPERRRADPAVQPGPQQPGRRGRVGLGSRSWTTRWGALA